MVLILFDILNHTENNVNLIIKYQYVFKFWKYFSMQFKILIIIAEKNKWSQIKVIFVKKLLFTKLWIPLMSNKEFCSNTEMKFIFTKNADDLCIYKVFIEKYWCLPKNTSDHEISLFLPKNIYLQSRKFSERINNNCVETKVVTTCDHIFSKKLLFSKL